MAAGHVPDDWVAVGSGRRPHDDAALDADLAAWYDPTTGLLRIEILGPVDVHAAGPPPEERLRFHR